jgi:cell division septation protein DedD
MASRVENESEILLGNKQLLAVFAFVVLLLGAAFWGGYKLGENAGKKTVTTSTDTATGSTGEAPNPVIPTHVVEPDDPSGKNSAKADDKPHMFEPPLPAQPTPAPAKPESHTPPSKVDSDGPVLGKPKPTDAPKHGETFVQVMAVGKKEADATADILRQNGFEARAAEAPGNPGIFRVLVGPSKDPAELRNLEDKLRKIGYTKCFVQHY